ncbi:unnamed protein product [Hermetia illucens]|uniref:PX domain-containing protein n=1 Tax=Hermetia illucens TaxID=343691 RepID=A0A7R8U9X9_HERIL|nr:uncharacterized protein LOC119661400 [Hermetia illucens]CAD7076883.1 unnamed protein product [Hermetia illucens]
MSLRAIKKRESRPYRKQQQQETTHALHALTSHSRKSTGTELSNSIESPKHRSQSLPNLLDAEEHLLLAQAKKYPSWRSETDVSKLIANFEQNANLISAKSEVCLKTISVHRTVHGNMSRPGTGGIATTASNRELSTRYRNDTLNNNPSSPARRMSEHSISAYSQTSNLTTPSDIEVRGFADTACVRIPIIGYEVMEERARFTVYKLRVENPFSNDCWLVLRRYTDFVRLNNKLKQAFPHITLQLPRKKLFGDNFNSVFLDNRVQGLQRFVNSIMANHELRNASVVREFFCLDEPPTYSDSMEECRAIFEAQEETIAHLKLQLKHKDDLILSLQQKLRNEISEKDDLKSKFNHINSSTKCAKCGSLTTSSMNSSS